jgi:hypothetical protein
MAATKITYAEIPKHLPDSDHLRIFHRHNSFEDLPSFEVTRIEVRQAGRFFHHVVDYARLAVLNPVVAALVASFIERDRIIP